MKRHLPLALALFSTLLLVRAAAQAPPPASAHCRIGLTGAGGHFGFGVEAPVPGQGGYSAAFPVDAAGTTISLAFLGNLASITSAGETREARGAASTFRTLHGLLLCNEGDADLLAGIPAEHGLRGTGWTPAAPLCVLQPGGKYLVTFPRGSGVLTPGENDGLRLSTLAGRTTVQLVAVME